MYRAWYAFRLCRGSYIQANVLDDDGRFVVVKEGDQAFENAGRVRDNKETVLFFLANC